MDPLFTVTRGYSLCARSFWVVYKMAFLETTIRLHIPPFGGIRQKMDPLLTVKRGPPCVREVSGYTPTLIITPHLPPQRPAPSLQRVPIFVKSGASTLNAFCFQKKNSSGQIERKEGNSVETSKMRQMGGKTPYSRRKRALNCGPRKIGPKKRGPSWSKVAKQKWGRDIYAKFRRQKANYLPVANPVWNTHTHVCTHAKEKKMTESWRRALIHFYPTLASFSKLTSGTSP